MNIYKDHAVTFLKLKFTVLFHEKATNFVFKMSEHSCWGLSWKVASGFTNMVLHF